MLMPQILLSEVTVICTRCHVEVELEVYQCGSHNLLPGSPVFLTAVISPERGSNALDVIMLENVYPRSFSSAVLRRKPELSALCTTRPKIFGHTFDPPSRRARFYRGLKVGFGGLSSSNSSVAGSQSRSTFLSHLAGGERLDL